MVDFGKGVNEVKIKVLTTNTTDSTLMSNPVFKDKVIQPMKETVSATAEHGLSMSINIDGDKNILYDFGGLGFTIMNNLPIFQINPEIFEKAVLSHGHFDHFGSMFKLAPKLGENTEIIVSPEIYRQKVAALTSGDQISLEEITENFKKMKRQGTAQQLPGIKKKLVDKFIEDNNQILTETKEPVNLAPGIWTSGEIELFDKSELTPNLFLRADKNTFEEETFRDEIAIYIKVKDKGLIVLTGCGHTGIKNTIKHGQKISGIDKIYAVIGGFHLAWSTPEQIENFVSYFKELNPEVICGMHCTGFKFNARMMQEMPNNTTLGVVGTNFIL